MMCFKYDRIIIIRIPIPQRPLAVAPFPPNLCPVPPPPRRAPPSRTPDPAILACSRCSRTSLHSFPHRRRAGGRPSPSSSPERGLAWRRFLRFPVRLSWLLLHGLFVSPQSRIVGCFAPREPSNQNHSFSSGDCPWTFSLSRIYSLQAWWGW